MSEQVILPNYDKTKWGKGEWDNEPDRKDFIHAGFSCFILRNHTGNWCGYVGLPNTHSSYGKDYGEVDVDVHGGLTYANKCAGNICHVPESGMPDDVWWLGFDTAHSGDLTPAMMHYMSRGFDHYRNMEYAIHETMQLAEQLKEIK